MAADRPPRDGAPLDGSRERCGDCREVFFGGTDRRNLLFGGAVIAAGLALDPEAAEASDAAKLTVQSGDRFEIARGALKGEVARPDLLESGAAPLECFAMDPVSGVVRRANRLNRTLMLRLDPAEMDERTVAMSAGGVLVYSAVCTHKGCTIQSWLEDKRHLRCHCHLSEFAALTAGDVKGGPAKHQLPMVPIALDDEGFVVATAGFTQTPGGKTK